MKYCEKCGSFIVESTGKCIKCGFQQEEPKNIQYKTAKSINKIDKEIKPKEYSLIVARMLCIIGILVNLLVILLCEDDVALTYVFKFEAYISGITSFVLLFLSFAINKNHSGYEMANLFIKIMIGVLSISGTALFISLNSLLFGF